MNKKGITSKFLGCLLTGIFILSSDIYSADLPSAEVPFEWRGGHIVVKGSIGELKDLIFVIDTGASTTTVSKRISKKLGLKGKKGYASAYGKKVKIEEITLPNVTIGSLKMKSVAAWAMDRLSTPDTKISRMDALIGLDFLRRTNLSIDYETQTLRFGTVEEGSFFQSFYPNLPFLTLWIRIEDQPVRVMLDSGAEDLILFKRRVEDRFSMEHTREYKEVRYAAGKTKLRKVQINNFQLGESSWQKQDAFLMDINPQNIPWDGIFGIRSLGLKQLTIDFQNNRIGWEL